MKKTAVSLLLVLVNGFAFAQTKTTVNARDKAFSDTIQYSLGLLLAKQIVQTGIPIDNPALFKKAIDDVLQNKPLMVKPEGVEERLANYQKQLLTEKGRRQEIELFTQLKSKAGIGVLPSGVNYLVAKTGTGIRPGPKDTVILNLTGMLPDGAVFQSFEKEKKTITVPVTKLIAGMAEAVQLMTEGSVWRVFIPSALAFGEGNGGPIPPNSAVIFDVALVQVLPLKP